MVLGIGADIAAVERFAALKDQQAFLDQFLTPAERARAPRITPERYYASLFALKEAVLKALGCGLAQGSRWHEIEVSADLTPALTGFLKDLADRNGVSRLTSSVSWTGDHAVAWAIAEGE
jgi:holo-[acyl-carrier protein] synthase